MEDSIENKMAQYYKVSKRIPYSTRVYGDKEEESKPNIILKPMKVNNGRKISNIKTLLILKYKTLNGIPVEVVLGTVNSTYDLMNKTEKIIELIEKQLRDNAKEIEGYETYSELINYKKEEKFSLDFTLEGLEILSSKNPKESQIDKTYYINNNDIVENLFTEQELEQKKKKKVPEVAKYQAWQEGRKEILKKCFTTEKAKETFLKGEEIAKTMSGMEITEKDTPKIVETKKQRKRNFVANYLLDVYDGKITKKSNTEQNQLQNIMDNLQETKEKVNNSLNSQQIDKRMRAQLEQLKSLLEDIDNKKTANEQESNIQTKENEENELLKQYLKIKEKGIAIDINIFLEDLEERLTREIQRKIDANKEENGNEIEPKDYNQIQLLQKYQHFFNFVKKGMDRTARFYAIKEENINFEILERVFEKYNKQDLVQYVKAKSKMVEETKTEDITEKEHDYSSVRDLYEVILKSEPRKMTKEDDNDMFFKIYEKAKRHLLENNTQEIKLYNYYAKKFKAYECPTYEPGKEDTEKNEYPTTPGDPNDGSR